MLFLVRLLVARLRGAALGLLSLTSAASSDFTLTGSLLAAGLTSLLAAFGSALGSALATFGSLLVSAFGSAGADGGSAFG